MEANRNYSGMGMITKDKLVSYLKEKGLKMTPQRLAIIDALVGNREEHPGAQLIYSEARKNLNASVYQLFMQHYMNVQSAA
jgi:Fe2+ or Zn2+ uptake regulation protein